MSIPIPLPLHSPLFPPLNTQSRHIHTPRNTNDPYTINKDKPHKHKPTVYLIRHAENSPKRGDKGLSRKGRKRAECLRDVFGKKDGNDRNNTSSSASEHEHEQEYDIGYIIVPRISKNKHRHRRPYLTVLPLAKDLGLDIDSSCKHDDPKCVAGLVHDFEGPGDILIAWRHSIMAGIVEEMGKMGRKKGKPVAKYPKRFDIIWTVPYPYDEIANVESEHCLKSDTDPAVDIIEETTEYEDEDQSESEFTIQL